MRRKENGEKGNGRKTSSHFEENKPLQLWRDLIIFLPQLSFLFHFFSSLLSISFQKQKSNKVQNNTLLTPQGCFGWNTQSHKVIKPILMLRIKVP